MNYSAHMKHPGPGSRLRVKIELVPGFDEFVPRPPRWVGAAFLQRFAGREVRSHGAHGFVPAANGVVPQIGDFLEI